MTYLTNPESYLVVDFADLNLVLIVCEHCGTELMLDAAMSKSECPGKCPSCRNEYNMGLSAAFDQFKDALHALKENGAKVRIATP